MESTPRDDGTEQPLDQPEHPSQAEGEDPQRAGQHPDPQRPRPSQAEGEGDSRSEE